MPSTLSSFFLPLSGLRLVMTPGLRRFVVFPVLINTVIFAALAWIGIHYFEIAIDGWLPSTGWLSYLRGVLWILFALAYLIILFFGFTLLANLIAAPFNSLLAARVEEKITGSPPPDDKTSLLRSIGPSISAEIGKLFYLGTRALPLLLLMLIPGVNLLASIGWLLFGAWFLAVEYGDYPMANHAIRPKDQRKHLKKRRLKSLAFGSGVAVIMLIPIMQFVAMPAAVAGATQLWLDELKPQN